MYEYKCTIVKVIDGDTVDVDIESIQAAYTMGSMAVKIQNTETTNPNFVNNTSAEHTEVNVSFSF